VIQRLLKGACKERGRAGKRDREEREINEERRGIEVNKGEGEREDEGGLQ